MKMKEMKLLFFLEIRTVENGVRRAVLDKTPFTMQRMSNNFLNGPLKVENCVNGRLMEPQPNECHDENDYFTSFFN